jgi:hypothetical protein
MEGVKMSTFKTLKSQALSKRRATLKAKAPKIVRKKDLVMFITRRELSASAEQLTDQQRAQLRDARARAAAVLAKPSMSAEALRARAQRAAQWEKEHGTVSTFAGIRR